MIQATDAMLDQAEAGESLVLSDQQAAGLFGCSRSHWRAMQKLGQVPAPIKIGRNTRWRRAELVDWLNANCPPQHKWKWTPKRKSGR